MRIIDLTTENIDDYIFFIGEDAAENIGRSNYHGLIAQEDEQFRGGIIWQYKTEEEAKESAIEWFWAYDRDIAKNLFSSYTELIREEDVDSSTILLPAIENQEEKEILKEAGFHLRLTETDKIIVKLSELSEMPLMKNRKIPKGVTMIGDISVRQLRNGIERCVANGKKGLCEDLGDLPISVFEPDVSTCYLNEKGEVEGLLLFHELPSGILSIQLMTCLDNEVAVALPGMMRLFVTRMEEKYPPDTLILLNRHNQASLLLSEKLLPRSFGIPEYAGRRMEAKKEEKDD